MADKLQGGFSNGEGHVWFVQHDSGSEFRFDSLFTTNVDHGLEGKLGKDCMSNLGVTP